MSSYGLALLGESVNLRAKSDRRLYFWKDAVLLPLITLGIWSLLVMYWFIDRRDEHFRREATLNRNMLQLLKERVQSLGIDPLGLPEMLDLETAMRAKEEEEQPKGAGLWVILGIVTAGLVWLYPLYFLTVGYYKHEQRQIEIVRKINAVLARTGATGSLMYNSVLPERHYWLNMLATVLTLGLWAIIWHYRMLSDPNRHFENQWSWENVLGVGINSAWTTLGPVARPAELPSTGLQPA